MDSENDSRRIETEAVQRLKRLQQNAHTRDFHGEVTVTTYYQGGVAKRSESVTRTTHK